ncbi:MAG: hypothetical protein AAB646_01155 [Patescibacteria group bacterium]
MKNAVYTTLQGEKLNLKKLTKEQKELLRRFYNLYKNGYEFMGYCNAMNLPYNLKIMGAPCLDSQCWINLKVLRSVIYGVLRDLGDRLAIQQLLLKRGANSNPDFTENEKILMEFLSDRRS